MFIQTLIQIFVLCYIVFSNANFQTNNTNFQINDTSLQNDDLFGKIIVKNGLIYVDDNNQIQEFDIFKYLIAFF